MGDIVTATATATKRALADDLEKAVKKRAKLEEKPTFRRKFNEDQFKHSKEMGLWTRYQATLRTTTKTRLRTEAATETVFKNICSFFPGATFL